MPASCIIMAATYPSPALFPVPQTTATGGFHSAARKMPSPARRISSIPGIKDEMVIASLIRISPTDNTSCITSLRAALSLFFKEKHTRNSWF